MTHEHDPLDNGVRMEPEVSVAFPDEESVNAALLSLIRRAALTMRLMPDPAIEPRVTP